MDRIIPGVCLLLVAAIIVAGLIWLRSMARKNEWQPTDRIEP